MEKSDCYISYLPQEIILKIFKNLKPEDLLNLFQVSYEFKNMATKEEIWSFRAQQYFGNKANLNGIKQQSYKMVCMAYKTIVNEKFELKEWDIDNIRLVLFDEAFQIYEYHLLKKLETAIIKLTKDKISTTLELLAALLAFCTIEIKLASDAVYYGAMTQLENSNPIIQPSNWRKACLTIKRTFKSRWKAPWSGAKNASWVDLTEEHNYDPSYDPDPFNEAYDLAYDHSFWMESNRVVESLELIEKNTREEVVWKLNNLSVLAFISQNEYLEYFFQSFNEAKNILGKNSDFSIPKENLIQLLADEIWEQDEHQDNPYIMTLKRIALNLADKIQEMPYHLHDSVVMR